MARTVKTPKSEAGGGCRGCMTEVGRLPKDSVNSLSCGDVYCTPCLTSLARTSLHAPSLLPLRCCNQPIPSAMLSKILNQAELAYYGMLVKDEVEKKREAVGTTTLSARCDVCGKSTRLETKRQANEHLLDCGHVYCIACLKTQRASAKSFGHKNDNSFCCSGLNIHAAVAMKDEPNAIDVSTSPPSPQVVATEAPNRRISPRTTARQAAASTAASTKGKNKAGLQSARQVVSLTDSDKDKEASTEEACSTCACVVDPATNRYRAACGHVFCRECIQQRCQRAITNEDEGSIGFPLRCCGKLVALDTVRAALSKRVFAKYEKVVAKRADVIPQLLRGSKRVAQSTSAGSRGTKKAKVEAFAEEENEEVRDEETQECVACMTQVEQAGDRLSGPCGHVYCVTCLAMMAQHSLENRTLVPIRCCGQEFPIEYVQRVLTKAKMAQYQRFVNEKDWKVSDLKSDKEYAQTIKKAKGKQCPSCGVGVQKIDGCNAITCPRGHRFCWKCLQVNCTCGRIWQYY